MVQNRKAEIFDLQTARTVCAIRPSGLLRYLLPTILRVEHSWITFGRYFALLLSQNSRPVCFGFSFSFLFLSFLFFSPKHYFPSHLPAVPSHFKGLRGFRSRNSRHGKSPDRRGLQPLRSRKSFPRPGLRFPQILYFKDNLELPR